MAWYAVRVYDALHRGAGHKSLDTTNNISLQSSRTNQINDIDEITEMKIHPSITDSDAYISTTNVIMESLDSSPVTELPEDNMTIKVSPRDTSLLKNRRDSLRTVGHGRAKNPYRRSSGAYVASCLKAFSASQKRNSKGHPIRKDLSLDGDYICVKPHLVEPGPEYNAEEDTLDTKGEISLSPYSIRKHVRVGYPTHKKMRQTI